MDRLEHRISSWICRPTLATRCLLAADSNFLFAAGILNLDLKLTEACAIRIDPKMLPDTRIQRNTPLARGWIKSVSNNKGKRGHSLNELHGSSDLFLFGRGALSGTNTATQITHYRFLGTNTSTEFTHHRLYILGNYIF